MTENFKIVVFASGAVGQQILDFVWSNNPRSLVKVVIDHDREPREFQSLRTRMGERLIMPWSAANQPGGVEELQQLGADVAVLAWWPHIIRSPLLKTIARKAVLNLHPSLLPHCRGKDTNFWSIVERRPFGVTIHHVVEDIDAGDIAFQEEIPVGWEDTGETLYRKAETALVRLFKNSYSRIARCDIPRVPQELAAGSAHKRRELEEASAIDLNQQYSARQLLDLLRARSFPPHPGCRFVDGDATYQVRLSITRVQ